MDARGEHGLDGHPDDGDALDGSEGEYDADVADTFTSTMPGFSVQPPTPLSRGNGTDHMFESTPAPARTRPADGPHPDDDSLSTSDLAMHVAQNGVPVNASKSQYGSPAGLMPHAASFLANDSVLAIQPKRTFGRTPSRQARIAEKLKDPEFRRKVDHAKAVLVSHNLEQWHDEVVQGRLQAYRVDLANWMGAILGIPMNASTFMRDIGALCSRLAVPL